MGANPKYSSNNIQQAALDFFGGIGDKAPPEDKIRAEALEFLLTHYAAKTIAELREKLPREILMTTNMDNFCPEKWDGGHGRGCWIAAMDCLNLLKFKYKFGASDEVVQSFYDSSVNRLSNSKEFLEFAACSDQIEKQFKQIDSTQQAVHAAIQSLRQGSAWHTIGMNKKADRIEAAMAKVPLDQRHDLNATKEGQEVLKELASSRLLHFFNIKAESSTSQTFKMYKQLANEGKPKATDESPQKKEEQDHTLGK